MRVSECFEVKTKDIMKAEVDLSLNYTYYLRNGLIYGWGNYLAAGEEKISPFVHFAHFQIYWMMF